MSSTAVCRSFHLQVDSPTSKSFRLHDRSRFAYIEVDLPTRSGAIIGDGDRKRAPFLEVGLPPGLPLWYRTNFLFLEEIALSRAAHTRAVPRSLILNPVSCGHTLRGNRHYNTYLSYIILNKFKTDSNHYVDQKRKTVRVEVSASTTEERKAFHLWFKRRELNLYAWSRLFLL